MISKEIGNKSNFGGYLFVSVVLGSNPSLMYARLLSLSPGFNVFAYCFFERPVVFNPDCAQGSFLVGLEYHMWCQNLNQVSLIQGKCPSSHAIVLRVFILNVLIQDNKQDMKQ